LGIFLYVKNDKEKKREAELTKSVGRPKVGGPFTLVNHLGEPFTNLQLKGRYVLLYFGFTHCPDICPTELKKLSKVMNILEKEGLGDSVQPLFIAVDPNRDSVAQVREYVADFHPRLMGLTGTPEQIEKVTKSYRVYFSKAQNTLGEKGEDDYLLDHSIILYFMDQNGDFLEFFGTNVNEEYIADKMKKHITHSQDKDKPKSNWWNPFKK